MNELMLGSRPLEHAVTFGEVVAFHVADDVLDGTRVDAAKLDALGRLAGMRYASTRGPVQPGAALTASGEPLGVVPR